MADPFDQLMNDPEWQALGARYQKMYGPVKGAAMWKEKFDKIQKHYQMANNTAEIPGNASPTASAAPANTGTFTVRRPIMPEVARKAKMHDEAQHILAAAKELQDLYNKKIKPKIDSGQISPTGQGLDYTQPGMMRTFGGQQDPDVREFITKSGPFSQQVNAYYSAGSGSKAGVGSYQIITSPHIPHPPASASEVLGLNPFSHQQWDLQKQGEILPDIIDYVQGQEGMRPPKTYGDTSAGIKPLDDAAKAHGVDW